MIVCRTCGGHNAEGDTFCGSCGEFLEWTGEKLDTAPEQLEPPTSPVPPAPQEPPPPPPAAESTPVATAHKPAASEFKPAVSGFTPAVSGSRPAASSFTPAGTTGSKPVIPEQRPTGSQPQPSGPEPEPAAAEPEPAAAEPGQRAAAALVAPHPPNTTRKPPAAPGQPDPGPVARKPQPQEMRPQAQVRRRPTTPIVASPPTRQLQPDDLICGMCGEGNPPTRRFCSRCGDSLQTATVVPTPWWRRILRSIRQRRVHPAGARPKRRARLLTLRGLTSSFRRMMLVALMLVALAYAVFPSMRSAVNDLARGGVDRIAALFGQKDVPVRPISTEATAQVPDHPATLAVDRGDNTFWKAPNAQAKPTLVMRFDHPTHIERAIVFNGASGDEFGALARPRQLHVVYFDGDTPFGVFDVTLEDKPAQQEVKFGNGDTANRVEVQVTDVYRSPDSPDLGLTEIELFERQQ